MQSSPSHLKLSLPLSPLIHGPFPIPNHTPTAPIDTLPYELLLEIFSLCHLDDIVNRKIPLHSYRYPPGSIRLILSWVSRPWRIVALSCPSLWRLITGRNLEFAKECIARSKPLRLSLSLEYPLQDFQLLHDHPTPLRSLMECDYSRLNALNLSDCKGDWISSLPLAPYLTVLTVLNPERRVPFATLMATLKSMRCQSTLTYLKFACCMEDTNNPDIFYLNHKKGSKLSLPMLEDFSIIQDHENERSLFALLNHLDFPQGSVYATLCNYSNDYDDTHIIRTFESFEEYRKRTFTLFWRSSAFHNISVEETSSIFAISISDADAAEFGGSPLMTLRLLHGEPIPRMDIGLLAAGSMELFVEDIKNITVYDKVNGRVARRFMHEVRKIRQANNCPDLYRDDEWIGLEGVEWWPAGGEDKEGAKHACVRVSLG